MRNILKELDTNLVNRIKSALQNCKSDYGFIINDELIAIAEEYNTNVRELALLRFSTLSRVNEVRALAHNICCLNKHYQGLLINLLDGQCHVKGDDIYTLRDALRKAEIDFNERTSTNGKACVIYFTKNKKLG